MPESGEIFFFYFILRGRVGKKKDFGGGGGGGERGEMRKRNDAVCTGVKGGLGFQRYHSLLFFQG